MLRHGMLTNTTPVSAIELHIVNVPPKQLFHRVYCANIKAYEKEIK